MSGPECIRHPLRALADMQFGEPSGPWHGWFAWFPVRTIDDRWTWLRRIYRRRFYTKPHLDGPQFRWWVYGRTDGALS